MGYESYICGSIEIDRDRWEAFCSENSEVQETWEGKSGNMVFNTLFEDECEWEGDRLVIGTTWRKQNDFEKFLDKVVRLLNADQTGYFDWHGEDFARSSFYLKKDQWEELEWKKPPPPKWWLEIRNKKNKNK
jgi:hypothetical protein